MLCVLLGFNIPWLWDTNVHYDARSLKCRYLTDRTSSKNIAQIKIVRSIFLWMPRIKQLINERGKYKLSIHFKMLETQKDN